MNKIRVLMYSPFIGNSGEDGPHMSIGLDRQLTKFFDRMKKAYFAQIDGPDVLPIFLAPEWYFARASRNYQASDVGRIFQTLLKWSKLMPKLLIVGGSIAWSIPFKAPPKPIKIKRSFNPFKKKKKPEDIVISAPLSVTTNPVNTGAEIVYNTVPIVRDGEIIHIYHKRYEGGEIEDSSQQYGFTKYPIPGFGSILKFDNTSLFTHEGISFGLEVCADHANMALMNEIAGIKSTTEADRPNATGVDVHLLVACGSMFNKSSIAARSGGYCISCDASTKDPGNRKAAQFVGKVTKRPHDSIFKSYQLSYQGQWSTLTPDLGASRTNPERYRRFVDDRNDDTRIGIFKDLCVL